jgi:hypothetical protein
MSLNNLSEVIAGNAVARAILNKPCLSLHTHQTSTVTRYAQTLRRSASRSV